MQSSIIHAVQRLIPLELNVDLDVESNPPVGPPLPEQESETMRDGSQPSHESRRRPQRNAALKARERIINWAEDSIDL